MKNTKYYNDRMFIFINKELNDFVRELSNTKDNSKKEIGKHHVINDALLLLYQKKKGKKFDQEKLYK